VSRSQSLVAYVNQALVWCFACGPPCLAAAQPAPPPATTAVAPERLAGLTVEQAIAAIERMGVTVFYSSELVRPSMRVAAEPAGQNATERLIYLLAAHGLATRPGPRGSLLVVRAPPSRPAQPGPIARAAGRTEGAAAPPARETIEEIVVAASQYELARTLDAPVTLTATDLENLPDLGDDPLRAVQRLPGAASNGFSARANVRGGEVGETLIRFDRLRLYDPFHLQSFQSAFSTIDPRIVSTMAVHTGAFPAMFGDRLSSVVDVSSIAPPAPRYHEVSVSFFNTAALTSGLLKSGGEWVASARRSNLDVLYDRFSQRPERPRYIDAFAKLSHRVSDALRITGSALYFRDHITLHDDFDVEEIASTNDQDRYVWLRFDHTVGNALTGSTLVANASLDHIRSGITMQPGVSEGSLDDRRGFEIDTLQSDWSWRTGERVLVQFGALAARVHSHYRYAEDVDFDLLFATPGAPTATHRSLDIAVALAGRQLAAYANVRVGATERLTADLGLRYDAQTLSAGDEASLAPRLALRYRIAPATFLRAGWGRFYQSQAINELDVADGEASFLPPQRADQAIVGVEHDFASGLTLRAEAYRKTLDRLRPRYENLLNGFTLLPELKPDRIRIAPDAGFARGLELLLTGPDTRPLRWWLGYTWAEAADRIDGREIPRSWDQARALSAGLARDSAKWSVATALNYHSGWPTTNVRFDPSGAVPVVVAGARNAARLSDYGTVDFRLMRKFVYESSTLSAFVELTNVTNRHNRCCSEFQIEPDVVTGEPTLDLSELDYLRLVPSLGFVLSF
jgi:TonB dependent receptor-like, beta-barrel